MDNKEVMQQALEALENERYVTKYTHIVEAIIALRTALEQPEQGPTCPECKAAVLYECVACSSNNYPPKPEQVVDCPRCGHVCSQRPWQVLTDGEFLEACEIAERGNYLVAFQRIQTKLKERNT